MSNTESAAARLRDLKPQVFGNSAYPSQVMADVRAILDERDAMRANLVAASNAIGVTTRECDALRAELESARRVIALAEDATWAAAALGYCQKREVIIETLRHACREFRERFGGNKGG